MDTSEKEIIDLTGDHEVIVLDSDTEEDTTSAPSKTRTPSDSNEDADKSLEIVEGPTQSATRTRPSTSEAGPSSQVQDGKSKKARRRKKRKSVVTVEKNDGEEGEIVEVSTPRRSAERSREQSKDRSISRGSDKDLTVEAKSSKGETKERGRRSAAQSLSETPQRDRSVSSGSDTGQPDPKDVKEPRKRGKKRKHREKVREQAREDRVNGQSASRLPLEIGEPEVKTPPLFFVDVQPGELLSSAKLDVLPPPPPALLPSTEPTDSKSEEEHNSTLLLPAHVTVAEGDIAPIQILPLPPADSDDDYIEYLDYDDNRRAPGLVRYFDDPAEIAEAKASKAARIVCKKCGAEGEHKTWDCPVTICLTCGARDEHITRSCPISKICFTCGMKGHVNRTCPNRYAGRGALNTYDDCDRCGSSFHNANECPTLWRMYDYVEDAARQLLLSVREEKRDLAIGEGGEGYIAPEDWCYNCGGCGHLGDDCKELPHPYDTPREPSAFSEYNTMTGPFYDAAHPTERAPSKTATYAARSNGAWGDGYGGTLPLEVGRQAKKKERQRLEKRAKELQVEDDEDDWFANRGSGSGARNGGEKRSLLERLDTKKISIGSLSRNDRRFGRDNRDNGRRESDRDRRRSTYYDDLPQPMRETETLQIRGASRRDGDWDGSIRGAASRRVGDRNDRKDRSRHRDRRSPERRRDRDGRALSPRREPRYRGGYSR